MINWQDYHAYRVFGEFIARFVLQRKSYITKHGHNLDVLAGIAEIKKRFVEEYDESSDKSFTEKLEGQFKEASEDTKIIFSNLEYLWAMPYSNISPKKKMQYVQRWFSDDIINGGPRYFFSSPHTIANPGQWNNQNKYWEICAVMRVIEHVMKADGLNDVSSAKRLIETFTHTAIYDSENLGAEFKIEKLCASHNALLHLSNPDQYEAIVAYSDKEKIVEAFGSLIEDRDSMEREPLIKAIKSALYDRYAAAADPTRKERWFFYQPDVKPLWKKKTRRERNEVGIRLQIESEENARDLDDLEIQEGEEAIRISTSLGRSGRLAAEAKKRDRHTCRACGFHFKNRIVQVHHLDPLGERKSPEMTKLTDLIALCPNCHYLAHYLLTKSASYKQQNVLVPKLRNISVSA